MSLERIHQVLISAIRGISISPIKKVLSGKMFSRDSRKVLNIIKDLTLETYDETYIKGLKCIRKAMQELQDHYDGTSEGARRKKVARDNLRKIFYSNQNKFYI